MYVAFSRLIEELHPVIKTVFGKSLNTKNILENYILTQRGVTAVVENLGN